MNVKNHIEIIRTTNQTFVKMMSGLSTEQLNTIPQGFNNNMIWNFAHSLAVQQAFFYGLSGLSFTVDAGFINTYKKGTKPGKQLSEMEISAIIKMFADSINTFERDYNNGIFKTYQHYTTSIGFVITSIEEAIQAASFHDGWHFGYAKALKVLV